MSDQPRSVNVKRLAWRDPPVAKIKLPGGTLRLTLGIGSALARRPGDPEGRLWGLGDRGANLKAEVAIDDYGLTHLEPLRDLKGLKLLPRPDVGPTLAELQVGKDRVRLIRALPLKDPAGRPISGCAPQATSNAEMEPTFDLDGHPLAPAPGGADTEGLGALSDGSFWVGEEYGPSLIKVDADGRVIERWVPRGSAMTAEAVGYPVRPVLPAIAARRRINRGFEAVTISADETRLHIAFQSALDRPEDDKVAPFARIWTLDAGSGEVLAQHLYPFDPPDSFRRDAEAGKVDARDLKICELAVLPDGRLLVLERISKTAKIYRVDLTEPPVPAAYLDTATRPTLEELDAGALAAIPALTKTAIFTTDAAPKIAPDLEGMALVSDRELILATDNDFGIERVETSFYRLRFQGSLGA
jgi:hypothetical protein